MTSTTGKGLLTRSHPPAHQHKKLPIQKRLAQKVQHEFERKHQTGHQSIEQAQTVFHQDLLKIDTQGDLSEDMYHRYLSFQYHLNNGVQRAFLKCVGHPDVSGNRKLREYLFSLALTEESHYRVAEPDLTGMGLTPLPMTVDVAMIASL